MKHIILFIFLYCGLGFTLGQDSHKDQLREELSGQKDKKAYLRKLTKSEKDKHKLSNIFIELGFVFDDAGDLDSAEYCYRIALDYAKQLRNGKHQEARANNNIGILYYYRGQHDTAAYYFENAIPNFNDKKLKANALTNLAIMNKYSSKPDVAVENLLSALKIYEELQDTAKQINVYNSISSLYVRLREFQKAKNYIKKGLKLSESDKYIERRNFCKSTLATIYNHEGKEEIAIPILKETIAFFRQKKDYSSLIANLNNLASSYSGIGNMEQAKQLYLEVIDITSRSGFELNKDALLMNLATCYEETKEYDVALEYYQKSLAFAKAHNSTMNYELIYKGLSSVHLKLNNSDSSIYYKDLQIALRDSLDQIEKEKKMMELESKYQNDQLGNTLRNKEKQLQESESERSVMSKGLFYALVLIVVAGVAVILLFVFYKRKKRLAQELANRNKQNRENISTLESSLGSKEEEIERLSSQQGVEKLPYPNGIDPLTAREKEVLMGVKEGLKDQEIADKLFISIATVRTHLRKAYVKIDARNRAEAIQFISKHEI